MTKEQPRLQMPGHAVMNKQGNPVAARTPMEAPSSPDSAAR
jgi:hypothetical protein